VIIGGPNGAGKTTFARSAAREWSLRYLGADLIAERLGLGSGGAEPVRAGRVFSETVRAAIAIRESLLVESTLSGLGTGRLIRQARDAGYRVSVGLVFVDSTRSLLNFWERYRFGADRWHLIYNGSVGAVRVASGSGTRTLVLEPAAFERWLRLVEVS
jgi:predicted ABC-type ATPase